MISFLKAVTFYDEFNKSILAIKYKKKYKHGSTWYKNQDLKPVIVYPVFLFTFSLYKFREKAE